MENPNILLDFEVSDEQIQMLSIHSSLKEAGTFSDLKYKLEKEPDLCDKIQVWFECYYNDNWYDVNVIYADLIKDDKIILKHRLSSLKEIELKENPFDEGHMMSYTITPKFL